MNTKSSQFLGNESTPKEKKNESNQKLRNQISDTNFKERERERKFQTTQKKWMTNWKRRPLFVSFTMIRKIGKFVENL